MQRDKQKRRLVLARFDSEIKQKGQRLAQLEEDRQQLEDLLEELRRQETPSMPDSGAFAGRQGTLPWPVKGKVSARFGTPRDSGKLKWQGIMIDTHEGADVRAVAPGTGGFADWMRGYGLLLIIDHGDGYMSLYGQNQALHKNAGDPVADGETIASVGDSGGRNSNGLYFEIRYQGKPSNPLAWLRK